MAEEELANLYLALVGSSKQSYCPIRRAFGAIESNSGRRKAIEAAAEAYFDAWWEDKIVRRQFYRLIEAVAWASKRRDDIAHGVAHGYMLDAVSDGSFLFPPDYNTDRTVSHLAVEDQDPLRFTMARFRFTSEQIRKFGDKFGELQAAIFNHRSLIQKVDDTILFVRAVTGGSALGA